MIALTHFFNFRVQEQFGNFFYLINNRRMFNVEIDDLARKPYIPHKNLLNEFAANALRDNIGIVIFDL